MNPCAVGHADGIVIVIEEDEPDGETADAQWISRRSLSIARRAFSWATKRRFMSSSPFEALTKIVVSAPNDAEDRDNGDQLDERVALLVGDAPAEPLDQDAAAFTSRTLVPR